MVTSRLYRGQHWGLRPMDAIRCYPMLFETIPRSSESQLIALNISFSNIPGLSQQVSKTITHAYCCFPILCHELRPGNILCCLPIICHELRPGTAFCCLPILCHDLRPGSTFCCLSILSHAFYFQNSGLDPYACNMAFRMYVQPEGNLGPIRQYRRQMFQFAT